MHWPEAEVTPSTKTIPDGSHQFAPVELRLEAAAATHAGQRESNEDVYGLFLDERLFVVADGMGGRSAGEIAARLAVDALADFYREKRTAPAENLALSLRRPPFAGRSTCCGSGSRSPTSAFATRPAATPPGTAWGPPSRP